MQSRKLEWHCKPGMLNRWYATGVTGHEYCVRRNDTSPVVEYYCTRDGGLLSAEARYTPMCAAKLAQDEEDRLARKELTTHLEAGGGAYDC